MAKIEEKIFDLAKPLVEEKDLELVDVEFVKEGTEWFLRFFIDKPEGITLDDCELISRILDPKLDEVDYISTAYHLEVSSPGIERPLKTTEAFQRFIGHIINVTTYTALNNQKKHRGKLISATDDQLVLQTDEDTELIIPREKVSKANLVWVEEAKS
ncbi:MAG: ribosome maturation factor RimP [Clostridia bacterium]|jgi:ribosome maturation factor RimP|nr:ribosome maturation factor RimP [Clostridia bacterium]